MRAEKDRLLAIDFDQRFKDLLRASRQANVSFYTVRPGGLDAGSSLMLEGTSNLVTLAEQTDGISLTASNDLRTGMAKIAADLSSHYVLGYYTNNTRWDGGARKLTVKLKSTGKAVRARREYRAPTEEEMSSIRNSRSAPPAAAPSAGQMALSALARVSPSSRLNAYGTMIGPDVAIVAEIAAAEIEGGRFKQGAERRDPADAEGRPAGHAHGKDRSAHARHARPHAGRRQQGAVAGRRAHARRGQSRRLRHGVD